MLKKDSIVLLTIFLTGLSLFFFFSCKKYKDNTSSKPKIVNIVNFIRLLEPRDSTITEDVLYQTVYKQVELMKKYRLKGTFLLQYDALMNKHYQELLKQLPRDSVEIGAWWEIPQPLVEKAGLNWRGRYLWDWHADVGFSTGYTPAEREKIADIYMEDFKKIFGYYPRSVASWFIDTYTLNYLYQKYHIVASANCKDQYGTDGYTLWGGYWNQAYYPSIKNSYMPAQNKKNQIPVPVFRMLGSDPVRQYDTGLESDRQGVITLEPVYKDAGGNREWVEWYFKEFINGEAMEFAYVQAGQENSFTWKNMENGFEIQMPLIAKLRDEAKIKVETLKESGEWFRKKYEVTPATSVTVTEDIQGSNYKTVWFNSRFFRTNFLWEDGTLRIRDIHMFDEDIESPYLDKKLESSQALFFTQPIVDGYLWSTSEQLAGIRCYVIKNGEKKLLKGKTPIVTSPETGTLQILWPLSTFEGSLILTLNEKTIEIETEGITGIDWFLDFTSPKKEELPFISINENHIISEFQGRKYSFNAIKGNFSTPGDGEIFRISPTDNAIKLDFSKRILKK
ncbi:hypothetical protein [Abyssalbus ytuae]|uniref:Uncharacterized protein n=1 Tax=Abyssalbus ytuae TaxID=2926907 RepID=A0A9E6ZMC9_9FLAO|nr:hypothetical protein [Abyssalbus ytuae]UOB18467.1 hypothetical protein MQE35_04045 [Abyssalbus ytuae]